MKKTLLQLLSLCLLLLSIPTNAQQALPYYVDFSDDSCDGWQISQQGDTISGPAYAWDFNVSAIHGNTGGINKNMVDDWVISPALDISSGAKVSFRFQTYLFNLSGIPRTAPASGDSFECYLLAGNSNPGLAVKTLLVNIPIDGTFIPHDTSDIYIPSVTGKSYIAFRYTATSDSFFSVLFTNLSVTPAPTAIKNVSKGMSELSVYPNPAKDIIYWDEKSALRQGYIFNAIGQKQAIFPSSSGKLNIQYLALGIYFLKIGGAVVQFSKE